MYFLNAVLFSCLIAKTICDSDKILLKFKSDVDKVGRSFEDLIFDVVKKIVDDVSAYQIDGDYYNSEEKTTQHSITKKILDSVENTTQENTTEETTASNRWIKNSTHPVDIFHNRLKRSASVNSTPPHEAKSTTASPINSTCPTKFQSEETLGFRQMEDLKGEIKKLQDLVVLLRDQQKIISLLDQNLDGFQSDFSSRFGARDVLKILDYVNNRDTQDREGKFSSSANSFELVDIKNDLKKAIATLNKTREILAMERKKEVLLEKELRDQKLDINFLKTMMEKLYKTDVNFHRDSIANDILGAVRHLPKELPSHNLVKAMKEGGNARRVQEIEEKVRVGNEHNSKTSDLDDLERILHKLNQPKNADTESKTLDSQKEMGKEKEEESLIKQLKSLEKYLERRKKHDINTHPNTESEIARKLQFAMQMMDEDKSRHLDEEIEVELQKLQEAIDNLRPKDDLINEIPFTYQPDDDNKRFQAMLKKIFSKSRKEQDEAERYQMMLNKFFYKENKREEDPVKQLQMLWDRMTSQGTKNGVDDPNIKEYDSLVKEITELRKQLASVKRSQMGNDNFYSNRDVYSYGYPDTSGKKTQLDTSSHSFVNGRPYYSPYMKPGYQDLWSQISNNRGSNQYFTEPSSPSYYAKPYYQDFVPMYFKSVPSWYQKTNKGSLNQNNMYNFEQNPYKTLFQTPKRPNTESSFNQNPYQGTFDQSKGFSIPTPPYKYNPEGDPNSKPLAELHGIPFTISVLPSQKAVSLDSTNSESHPSVPYHEPARNDQNLFQQDRDQFFHPPQQNIYPKPPSESIHPPEIPSRGDTGQPGGDPSKTEEKLGSVYRKVGDLKAQIYSLQNVIDDLNKHNYTQTPQDKGKHTNNLEGFTINTNPMGSGTSPQHVSIPLNVNQDSPPPKHFKRSRRRRSVESNEMEFEEDPQLYDQVMSSLKGLIFGKENPIEASNTYDDLHRRVKDLRYQLESRTDPKQRHLNTALLSSSYQPPYYQHNHFSRVPPKVPTFEMYKLKKNDVFTSIILNVLDKIIAATPAIVERLFGRGFRELSNSGYGDSYNYGIGYANQNDLQKLFRNLGFFGYGPLIILNLIEGFTTFMKILRRNQFFKNFLTPALVLLVVTGAIVFLVWWLQSDEDFKGPNRHDPRLYSGGYYDKYNEPYSNYNYHSGGYGNNNNNYGYGGRYGPPGNPRGYFPGRQTTE